MTAHYANEAPDQARARALQERLAELRRGDASILRTRLNHAHPWHITRVARGVFLALTIVCCVALIGSMVVPLFLTDAALMMRELQEALPLPLPMLILFLALLMSVAWVTAGQAALAIARDCPLLPMEQEELRKLESELSILTSSGALKSQSGLVADDRIGQDPPPLDMPASRLGSREPAGGRGYPSPVPTAGGTLRYEKSVAFPPQSKSPYAAPSPQPSFPPPLGAPTPGSRGSTSGRAPSRAPTGGSSVPGLPRRATPQPASSRQPSPGLSYRGPGGSTRATPRPVARTQGGEPADPDSEGGVVQYERRPHDSYTIRPDSQASLDDGGQPSWRHPRFGPVDEPWLQDALQKAQSLSARYPVQAFLEYSVEPDLPFTLVLERATPAMAVRAMVDFVGFLASISTPRRARIELRSVVHLDRSFYRSVMSAMEPYFPDTVEIRQQGYRVEVTFLEPDRQWARYPILPIEE